MTNRRKQRVLRKGIEFLTPWEGYRRYPYKAIPSETYWTWGIGDYGAHVPSPNSVAGRAGISLAAAQRGAVKNAKPVLDALLAASRKRLRTCEAAALISLGFNLGPGIFDNSHTIGQALRRGDKRAVAKSILLYDYAGGQRLEGLTRRRQAEKRLFNKWRRLVR